MKGLPSRSDVALNSLLPGSTDGKMPGQGGEQRAVSADIENWTSADTKSEPPGSDGGAVAGRVSGGSGVGISTVIGGTDAIDSRCGLWGGQGGQRP